MSLPKRRRQPSGMTSTSFQSSSGRLVPMSLTTERLYYEATRRSSDVIHKPCTSVKKYLYYTFKKLENYSNSWIRYKYLKSVFRILGSGYNQISGSGSRRAKMTHKSRKSSEFSCFEVLDVSFAG
jgi:hypothetical protein